jgi:hypothetical protein
MREGQRRYLSLKRLTPCKALALFINKNVNIKKYYAG